MKIKSAFKIVSKIFFGISIAAFVCAFLFLGAHTYFSDRYFNAIRDFHNPQSEFIANDKSEISILLVSDTGSNNRVLRNVLSHAMDANKYDFVMYMGDMTTNASVTSYYWMLNDIKPLLNNTPMYTLPGNHDITRRVGLTKKHYTDTSFYETVIGARYYWFGYGNTLFVTLDSSEQSLDDGQLVWLDNTLKKIRPMFKNCVIFGHVPPVNSRPDFFEAHITDAESTKKFESIIKKYKINAMFFGHVHFFSHAKFANIDFWTTPASGQSVRNPENPRFGYITVKINKNGRIDVTPDYVDFSGPKRDFFTEWFTRDVMSVKVRMIITAILKIALTSLIIAFLCRIMAQQQRESI